MIAVNDIFPLKKSRIVQSVPRRMEEERSGPVPRSAIACVDVFSGVIGKTEKYFKAKSEERSVS